MYDTTLSFDSFDVTTHSRVGDAVIDQHRLREWKGILCI